MENKDYKIDPDDDMTSIQYANNFAAPWLTKHISSILALCTVILSFALFFVLIFIPLLPEKKDIVVYILGVLSAIDTQIFSFYYGSSKDSETKNRMIHHQMSKKCIR
jgi:hypothetical protein